MTREEFIAQLNAEGVTDQTTRNQRISQAIASGQITGASAKQEPAGWAERLTQPAPEAEPAPTEVPAPVESPLGGGAGYALIQAAQPAKAEGLTPTFQTDAEKAQAEQAGQAQPALYQPGQEPGAAGAGMPRMPSVGLPGTGPLQATVQAVPGAFKEAEEGYSEAYGKLKKAVGETAEAQKEIAGAQAGVFEEQRKVSEELHAAQFEREQERRMVMDREVGKVRDSIEEINKAGVDPYRFYRHSDGSVDYPKSIASAIAVGLGALGSSLPRQYGGTGGPNMALQIIERAIDRDISAQRDDLANRRAGVGLGMNLLGQMRGKFADERQAEAASRAVMLDHYKIKLQEALAKTSNKKIAANAQKEIAAVDIKQAEVLGDIGIKAAMQEVAGEEKMLTAKTRRAAMKQRQNIASIKAMTPAAGRKLPASAVTKMADFRAAGGILGQVKNTWNTKMKGKFAGGVAANMPWATEAKQFEDKVKAAAQFVGKKLEGRMTDEDYERILGMFPTPGDSDTRAQAKFRALEGYLESMEDATIRTYGETGFNVSGFQKRPKQLPGEGAAE